MLSVSRLHKQTLREEATWFHSRWWFCTCTKRKDCYLVIQIKRIERIQSKRTRNHRKRKISRYIRFLSKRKGCLSMRWGNPFILKINLIMLLVFWFIKKDDSGIIQIVGIPVYSEHCNWCQNCLFFPSFKPKTTNNVLHLQKGNIEEYNSSLSIWSKIDNNQFLCGRII